MSLQTEVREIRAYYEQLLQAKDAQNEALKAQVTAQELQIKVQTARVSALEAAVKHARLDSQEENPPFVRSLTPEPSEVRLQANAGSSLSTTTRVLNTSATVARPSAAAVSANGPVAVDDDKDVPGSSSNATPTVQRNRKRSRKRSHQNIPSDARLSESLHKKPKLIPFVEIDPYRQVKQSPASSSASRVGLLPSPHSAAGKSPERLILPMINHHVQRSSGPGVPSVSSNTAAPVKVFGGQEQIAISTVDAGTEGQEETKEDDADHPLDAQELNVVLESERQEIPVKVEHGPNVLNTRTVQERLQAIGLEVYPVTLDPFIRYRFAGRAFFANHFGGNQQSFSTSPNQAKFNHGYRNFMFPHLSMNPHVPQRPGEPGLLCRATAEVEWQRGDNKVIVGLSGAQYLYVGEYALFPAAPLSKEEFQDMPIRMKRLWAGYISTRDKDKNVRVRIILRRQNNHHEPTPAEVKRAVKDKENHYTDVTHDEIIQAFERGDETIYIWAMKCVGYDERFQRDIARRLS
ncbi:uncharacterized protein LAESUDRAFT_721145 [Laetiporus sulphureus 93-53]|uniref:DUF6697 domain-containing protein n=1 Tax=Laetiporus sulphureus 93-53 TaxID=1314785 RepID=A0A165GSZ2_9APHY|nr:uncharacterized protein LAESUDRAFT_721145 [Laetiporus sulphureus 93-53]KZT10769.1 hypothetical protein LAESUDRAFT_721145 [Laetiporus sulphureus 93-53]